MLTDGIASALKKLPPLWLAIRSGMDAFYRVSMYPFGHSRRAGTTAESSQLVADTAKLNVAAEHYFTTFSDREFLLNKPFSDSEFFPRQLFNVGVVFTAIGLRQSDIVVEFGAGTCWVSHFLNRYGCKTISVDVSPTALALGRQMFERDPATRWAAGPEFLPYDGHRLPLADGSCDKIVVIDAFHHIPNQREILSEMFRVLTPNGIVGMSEPGLGHADSDASRHEVQEFGVLENELVIEDVGALAKSCGFSEAVIVTASPEGLWEVPTADLGAFIRGKNFVRYWQHQSNALLASHYIVLYKGDPRPSTRRPKALRAEITAMERVPVRTRCGERASVTLSLKNPTETRWIATPGEGWTRLGAHLYNVTADGRVLEDNDWLRASLPHDVEHNDTVRVVCELPAIAAPGAYEVVFDLVIEGVTWFEARGSRSLSVGLVVYEH